MTTTVADQRRMALSARRRLPEGVRKAAAHRACRRLSRLPVVRRARRIGIYHPLASEIDITRLVHLLPSAAHIYYPRVEDSRLRFVAPTSRGHTTWRTSALGVAEPNGRSYHVATLDVLIMPLAGFDARAARIGLGGGYYDRTLAALRATAYRGPMRIGFAFEAQRLAHIEARPWDVPLDAVVTERRVYRPATR
ncbi:5-formyltetrahydrofolate cyclo-ligase [Salinisphaera sp. Q1T1-3]|uniref:5-formyltetrahydrofolate cyclo-ligase n=1 Tax=Salinisphaera sp. Q1T1-3 TaxID=2321229 RepID=UPI000E72D86E|nr:5-formyltetrahydrofolate cyclo-ligase [Salinisphaera sp. Q1T1-3]RJS94673.1 5-formyltetrahydrofolate cyclo-ligase [Salinisphaera sp. Q1T1-3]